MVSVNKEESYAQPLHVELSFTRLHLELELSYVLNEGDIVSYLKMTFCIVKYQLRIYECREAHT